MSISGIQGGFQFSMQNMQGTQGAQGQKPPPPKHAEGTEGMEPGSDEFFSQITSNIMNDADADGSGSISIDEFDKDEELFNSFDSDGDGVLSSTEVESSLRDMHARIEAKMQEMGGPEMGPPPGGMGGKMQFASSEYSSQQTMMDSLFSEENEQTASAYV